MISCDANTAVHSNESLSAEQFPNIERELAGVRGVVSPCTHLKLPICWWTITIPIPCQHNK